MRVHIAQPPDAAPQRNLALLLRQGIYDKYKTRQQIEYPTATNTRRSKTYIPGLRIGLLPPKTIRFYADTAYAYFHDASTISLACLTLLYLSITSNPETSSPPVPFVFFKYSQVFMCNWCASINTHFIKFCPYGAVLS